MTLHKVDIDNLAKLARINVKEEEKDTLADKIDAVLGYVSEISSVDTSSYSHAEAGEHRNVLREDIPEGWNKEIHDRILDNVPDREGDYIKVQQIFE